MALAALPLNPLRYHFILCPIAFHCQLFSGSMSENLAYLLPINPQIILRDRVIMNIWPSQACHSFTGRRSFFSMPSSPIHSTPRISTIRDITRRAFTQCSTLVGQSQTSTRTRSLSSITASSIFFQMISRVFAPRQPAKGFPAPLKCPVSTMIPACCIFNDKARNIKERLDWQTCHWLSYLLFSVHEYKRARKPHRPDIVKA